MEKEFCFGARAEFAQNQLPRLDCEQNRGGPQNVSTIGLRCGYLRARSVSPQASRPNRNISVLVLENGLPGRWAGWQVGVVARGSGRCVGFCDPNAGRSPLGSELDWGICRPSRNKTQSRLKRTGQSLHHGQKGPGAAGVPLGFQLIKRFDVRAGTHRGGLGFLCCRIGDASVEAN